MTGRVEIADGDDDDMSLTFNINLRIRSVDPKRPLKGFVTFHLHETFDQKTYRVKAADGEAFCPRSKATAALPPAPSCTQPARNWNWISVNFQAPAPGQNR
ncbi:MAG: hypothetical protein U0132_02100 [Gemmatimonadaceae bacterium]